jgi:hypothetical protein
VKPEVWIDGGSVWVDFEPEVLEYDANGHLNRRGVYKLTLAEAEELFKKLGVHVGVLHAKAGAQRVIQDTMRGVLKSFRSKRRKKRGG